MNEFFKILKLKPGVTFQQVKQAYRERVRFWHPYRFPSVSKRLQERAHVELTRINEAYKKLEIHYQSKEGQEKRKRPRRLKQQKPQKNRRQKKNLLHRKKLLHKRNRRNPTLTGARAEAAGKGILFHPR